MRHRPFIFSGGQRGILTLGESSTLAIAYTVAGYWTSEDGWGESATEFTTSNEAVYINVLTHTDPMGVGLSFRWYKPNGAREYDVGTDLLAHRVYDDEDLLIGFWTYMVIKGMNREPGQWRVEHWAYGRRDGVLDWYLMFTAYLTITLEVAPRHFYRSLAYIQLRKP